MGFGMVRSIVNLDGPDSDDLRVDDDDAADGRGDMETGLCRAPNSNEGGERAARDGRPDSAA
jgi:hypothetical protein